MSGPMVFQLTTLAYLTAYVLVFLAFGLFWLRLFFPGSFSFGNRQLWPAVSIGAMGLLATLVVQPPIQTWVNDRGLAAGLSVWVIGTMLVLVSGIVQESLKAFGIAIVRFVSKDQTDWKTIGLAVGLGFGVWEAWQLAALPLGRSHVWLLLPVLERLSAIGLHIGVSAIAAYGFATKRPFPFVVLAALLHATMNFSVLLYQQWVLGFMALEIYVFVCCLVSLFLARHLWSSVREY